MKRCLEIVLLGAFCLGGWTGRAQLIEEPIRIGFTHGIFQNRNENDVLAAMMVWAQTLSKEHGIQIHPKMVVYPTLDSAEEAVRCGTVDAITLLMPEYVRFPKGLLNGPFFRDEKFGTTQVEFVLIGAIGGKVSKIEDLRGARLTRHSDFETVAASDWLSAQCVLAGIGPLSNVVDQVDSDEKLSGTVLRVFFGQSDACLVTREAFNSMVELNPQVGKTLAVIAHSPLVVPTLFAFRHDFSESQRVRLFDEVRRLHESVVGEQVLRVFKSDRMREVTAMEVKDSVEQLTQWYEIVGWPETLLLSMKKGGN